MVRAPGTLILAPNANTLKGGQATSVAGELPNTALNKQCAGEAQLQAVWAATLSQCLGLSSILAIGHWHASFLNAGAQQCLNAGAQ